MNFIFDIESTATLVVEADSIEEATSMVLNLEGEINHDLTEEFVCNMHIVSSGEEP